MAEAVIHLVAGATGAGKTTYSIGLAGQIGGVRFSIDDWMTTLFWMDSPQPIEFSWAMSRIERCEAMIRNQAAALVKIGVPAVLDLGFTRADHRTRFADFARGIGAPVRLHYVAVAADDRWARVQGRNAERGETYAMEVDRAMFEFMEREWQPPTSDEMAALDGVFVQ